VSSTTGVVLDAGAFIALERRNAVMVTLARRFVAARTPLVTSASVVAQVWRGGPHQAALAFLFRRIEIVDLTSAIARVLGRMLATARCGDPIDAHVALLARQRDWPVLSSDPGDLLSIDPTLTVERI
jgi:hypothetical protein